MKPKVYIDTTVVSYLTAQPSRDIVTAAHQQVTREWWESAGRRFNLVASDFVTEKAGRGDPSAACARLAALESVEILDATPESAALTDALLASGTLPTAAAPDATHVAIAVTHGIDYLVTWNLHRMANAPAREAIERACRRAGYRQTTICTPEQLLENGRVTSCKDPIVEEVRAIRASLYAEHGGTIEGLFKHYREVQRTSGRSYVSYSARRIEPEGHEARARPDADEA